jgi:hypothetical protein
VEHFWKWFDGFRRLVIFSLGCLCFLKGVIAPQNTIPELVIGMIMVGVLPIEDLWTTPLRLKKPTPLRKEPENGDSSSNTPVEVHDRDVKSDRFNKD